MRFKRGLIAGMTLALLIVISSPARCEEPPRALFVSVIQDPPVLSSRDAVVQLVDFAKQARIKILFVQVFRAGQAWFPSKIVDASPYERSRKAMGEDPLAFLIKEAHRQGIEVHAWLNLLSLATNKDAFLLKKYGTGVLTRNVQDKKTIEDFKIDEQYFLEPSDPRVRRDLTDMVQEILNRYPDLDGIQFDYIRYPDVKPHYGYAPDNVERFKKATGLKSVDDNSKVWKDWKRAQVTELLARLVKTTRDKRPHIHLSTTGCMPYIRAYDEAFQEWPAWLSSGLIDFVTVMDYSDSPDQFRRWITVIQQKVPDFSKIKISVGAYKLVKEPEVFKTEFRSCQAMGVSCAVFHYGSLLENPALKAFLTGP